jgi:hypothetical protein
MNRIARLTMGAMLLLCGHAHADAWQELAKQDLAFIRRTVEENHPGFVDPDNPAFRRQLEQSYRNVVAQLQYVHSLDAVLNLDHEFIASFADVHFDGEYRFVPRFPYSTGIRIERRQGMFVVTKVADTWPVALPVVGSRLMSCGSRSADDLLNQEVLRYRFANYSDEYPRLRYASKLLTDDGVGYRTHPDECVFLDSAGHETRLGVHWQQVQTLGAEWDSNRPPDDPLFRVEQMPGAVVWVRVPTFLFVDASERLKFDGVVGALGALHAGHGTTIVFDVRGNSGGSSLLGLKLLESALGPDNFWTLRATLHPALDVPARFRASRDNLEQIGRMADDPNYAAFRTSIVGLAAAMQRDLEAHHDWTLQPGFVPTVSAAVTASDPRPLSNFEAVLPRLVLLTDRFCVSACLDFVREVLAIPNAIHVGEQTSADTPYNEPLRLLNPFDLPSKLGFFHLPSKIEGARGPYMPRETFGGDIRDTSAVRAWVLQLPQLRAN